MQGEGLLQTEGMNLWKGDTFRNQWQAQVGLLVACVYPPLIVCLVSLCAFPTHCTS